jgi:hypothetical protein
MGQDFGPPERPEARAPESQTSLVQLREVLWQALLAKDTPGGNTLSRRKVHYLFKLGILKL